MADERDPLDLLLDEALAERGRSEPRPGLEGRVLAALRAEPPLPWWSAFLRPAAARVALASAGVLVLAVGATLFLRPDERSAPSIPAPTQEPFATEVVAPVPDSPARPEPAAAPNAPESVSLAAASLRPAPYRVASTGRVPRHSTFPAATPLGEQEQLLLRFVSEAPREDVERRAGFLDAPAPLPPLPDPTTEP